MDDQANFALLVLLLQSARQASRPGDFAEGTLMLWTDAIRQLKGLLPNVSPPPFSSVDQNLLNAFINAAIVTPPEPLDQVVYNAQIAVLVEPGMQEHYELSLLIEIALVARSDKTLRWQDVFIQAVQNIGLTGLEPQLIMEWNIDMNVVSAFVQNLRSNTDKSIADAINDAKSNVVYQHPSADELKSIYCGYEGFPCCKDPVDSCNEPDLLCDWDETCKRRLWPPSDYYSVNQTIPGDEIDGDWTDVVQGLATDGRSWYVVQGSGTPCPDAIPAEAGCSIVNQLWKVPFDIDWNQDWGPLDWESMGIKRIDNWSFPMRCQHWGDPEVHNGSVYVPMEDCPPPAHGNLLAEFDASTLEFLGMSRTRTGHAASVAINPRNEKFYVENTYDGEVWEFPAQEHGHLNLGSDPRKIKLGACPNNKLARAIQGIAFSPSGKLYVASDQDEGDGGVYAFHVFPNKPEAKCMAYLYVEMHHDDGQELEGLAIRDVIWNGSTRNQIHVLLYDNRGFWDWTGNAWFKHIAVKDSWV